MNAARWGCRLLRGLADDERGNIALIAAGAIAVAVAFSAIVVDLGSVVDTRRRLQSATDGAALAAVRTRERAAEIVQASLRDHGFEARNIVDVTTGSYSNAAASAGRFIPDGSGPMNAVRVTAEARVPLHVYGFMYPDGIRLETMATAVHAKEASFSAGTGLASLDDGILNALLSGLLGTSINLSLLDYNALVSANINLLSFLDALSTNIDLTAVSYDQLLDTRVNIGDLIDAALAVTRDELVLTALESLRVQVGTGPQIALGELIDIGLWGPQEVGSAVPKTAAHALVNLYDLISISAQVANGDHAVAVDLPVSIAGLVSLQLTLTIGEPEQEARIGIGPEGTSVHTAQTRLLLDLRLLDVLGTAVRVPLYLEVAAGDAYIDDIACGLDPYNDGEVRIMARGGVAALLIGDVPPGQMENFSQPLNPVGPARILNVLGLVQAFAAANASAGGSDFAPLTFDQADIRAGATRSVSSGDILSSLLGSLVGNLVLDVRVLGLDLLGLGSLVGAILEPLVRSVLQLLDPVIASLLQALGIKLGYIDVTVRGMRCGVTALVQ